MIKGNSLVAPAFILHVAASNPSGYSHEFPIYDRRTWNAYVYLWKLREEGERLYSSASASPTRYGSFCREFSATLPAEIDPRRYEQALFMFGG